MNDVNPNMFFKAKFMDGRNNTVEFYRFFFACVIYILHIRNYSKWETPNGVFNGGYLAVEFFFILSGFFIAERCKREQDSRQKGIIPEIQAVKFLKSKYKRLMPQYLLAIFVLLFVDKIIFDSFSLKAGILNSFSEIIGCSIFWRPSGAINLPLWYVSGLIWAGTLVYFLMLKDENLSVCILFPFSLMMFISYTYMTVGHIDVTPSMNCILAFFRAFVELGFGCILYNIYIRQKA